MGFSLPSQANEKKDSMMRILIFAACFLFSVNAFSQIMVSRKSDRHINQRASGVLLQHGFSFYDLPGGVAYRPLLLAYYKRYPIFNTHRNINLALEIGPQAGIGFTDQINLEVGMLVYLSANFSVTQWDMISFITGAGPHFISVETERQANGFVFSDNLFLSYRRKMILNRSPWELSIYGGFRHLSNAGIKQPNDGIDNIMVGLGFVKLI